jgi:2',3'-cyclic-nucleotide 2'-phosphodiesterase (5'-nucleotidase family)
MIRQNRWVLVAPSILIVALLLLFATRLTAQEKADSGNFHLTILHTNDLHSHDESFTERGHEMGGLARIGHLIRTFKKEQPDAVVVDAGDIFQGTPLYTKYHGEVEVHLLNMCGYDIFTIGNHEFDDGPVNLAHQLEKAKFKVINCNMDCSKVPELAALISPYVAKEINGQKVAFIGAVTPDLNSVALRTGGVTIKATGDDWMKPIEEQIAAVKAQGINKIVLVTHIGVELDRELGKNPDIDVIIGGHSHTRLDQAIVVPHADGSSCTIVQTGCFSRALGKLELTFNDKGEVITSDTNYKLNNTNENVPQDPDIKAYVDEMVKPLLPLRHMILGTAEGDFDNFFRSMPNDSPLGDLITDALAEEGKAYGVQLALENRGGIRGRIDAGPISMEKVEEILPFDNKVVLSTVTGDCLLQNLEHSVNGGLGGHFFDEHGMKIAYDPNQPKEHRIVYALTQDASGNWQPIQKDSTYKIATNDYSFDGGEGYNFKSATKVVRKPEKMMVALVDYLKNHPKVSPHAPDRIVAVDSSLLSADHKGSEAILHVRNAVPNSKVIFVAGTARGVGAIEDKLAVPINDPHVVQKDRCDADGHFDLTLPINTLFADQKDAKEIYASVIVIPPKSTPGKHITVSYPVSLN